MRNLGILALIAAGACGGNGASAKRPIAVPPAQGTLAEDGIEHDCTEAARRAWARRNPAGAERADRNLLATPRKDERPALTPLDGAELERARYDFTTTLRIRRALLEDRELSLAAKSVKIVTQDGKVTLRGPVPHPAERRAVETLARTFAGRDKVESRF